jgi:hypothetical protein
MIMMSGDELSKFIRLGEVYSMMTRGNRPIHWEQSVHDELVKQFLTNIDGFLILARILQQGRQGDDRAQRSDT